MGESVNLMQLLIMGIDFYIAWILIFSVLKLLKSNIRAVQIIKGVLLIYILNLIGEWFDLTVLNILIEDIITWGLLIIVIVFQPEIRSGLEQVGRNGALRRNTNNQAHERWLPELVESLKFLAEERVGALIVIEQKVSLEEFHQTGTTLQAVLSSALIRTIFRNKTPLHDGAVIIRHQQILCAGAILPSTRRDDLPQTVGTRHRAAIGISEMSDSITLVISEETGQLSIAYKGELERFEKLFQCEQRLRELLNLGGDENEEN